MATVQISTLSGILKDTWRFGIPKEMYTKASPLFGMVQKVRDWTGATLLATGKTVVYNYGLRSGLPGRGGSTYNQAFNTPGNTKNDEVKVTANKYFSALRIDHDALDFGQLPEALIEVKSLESEGHVQRTLNVLSKEFFSNGGGVIAKLNGVVGTPATGAVLNNAGNTVPLQLQNTRDFLNLNEGDRIQFSATDGLTGAAKLVVKTVASDPTSSGAVTLTTDLLAGDGVLDNDYVFQNGRFGLAFRGLTAWCPLTQSALSTDFFNLDQTSGKRGGHRINTKKGADPYAKLLEILKRAEVVSADIDCFAVTPEFMENLTNSSRYKQLVRVSGERMSNPLAKVYENMTKPERMRDSMAYGPANKAGKMRYGSDGICVRWPASNKDVYVYSEKFLSQSEVSKEADDLIIAFYMEDFKVALPPDNGWDWQDHDKLGAYRQVAGEDSIAAMYGVKGQICCKEPNNIIVAGSNVVE